MRILCDRMGLSNGGFWLWKTFWACFGTRLEISSERVLCYLLISVTILPPAGEEVFVYCNLFWFLPNSLDLILKRGQ